MTHSRYKDYATSLSVRGSNPDKGKTSLFSPKTSGLALGSTEPPVKLAIEPFPGVKRPGREVNHPRPTTAEINPLTPNDDYSRHTTPLTSKRCILYIYSTNIGTEYF